MLDEKFLKQPVNLRWNHTDRDTARNDYKLSSDVIIESSNAVGITAHGVNDPQKESLFIPWHRVSIIHTKTNVEAERQRLEKWKLENPEAAKAETAPQK